MVPIGAIVGMLVAARNAAQPTRALRVGTKYVLQSPVGNLHRTSLNLFMLLIPYMLIFLAKGELAHKWFAATVVLGMMLLFVLVSAREQGRHFLVDAEGIEVISMWRAPRKLRYAELVKIRVGLGRDRLLLKTSNGQKCRVALQLSGMATLARLVLQNRPPGVVLSPSSERTLRKWAAADEL